MTYLSSTRVKASPLPPPSLLYNVQVLISRFQRENNNIHLFGVKVADLGVVRKACFPTTEPEEIATTYAKDEGHKHLDISHLTVGVIIVQQLQLSGTNVAEVDRQEEKEDELALGVGEVEGGGRAVAQAGHLQGKDKKRKM